MAEEMAEESPEESPEEPPQPTAVDEDPIDAQQFFEVACGIRDNMFEISNIFLFSHIAVSKKLV